MLLQEVPGPALDGSRKAGGGRHPTGRRVLAVAVGVGVAAAAAWAVAAGALRGPVALATLAIVTLAVPTSRELARRVLIAGCLILGWVPLLWWWRLPLGDVGHVGLLLAGTLGGLVSWCLWDDVAARSRALLPRIRWTDGVVAGAAIVSAWTYAPGLRTSSPEAALTRLMAGWDNVAHFDMTEMIRRFGVMVPNAPTGSNGVWAYAAYPQGYHAVAATVMEALIGRRVVDPAGEVAAYSHALSLVALCSVVMVVAGVCSLPSIRRRPLLALPLTALVVATFELGPGGLVLANGFPNYFVALAVLCCLPLLAVQLARPASLPLLGALGGTAVALAHNWSLLLSMGALGAIVVLFPLRRSRWPRSVAGWIRVGAVGLATLVGLAMAGSLLKQTAPLGTLLTIGGGISVVPISQVIVSSALALGACIYLGGRRRDRPIPHGDDAVRTGWLALLVGAGVVTAAAIAIFEIQRGAPAAAYYYFWKYAIALQILSVVVVACAVPVLLPRRSAARAVEWRRPRSAALTGIGSLAVAVALFQVYGTPHVFTTPLGGIAAPGVAGRGQDQVAVLSPAPDAGMLLAAARATTGDSPYVFAVDSPSGRIDRMLLALWYMSLSGRWDAGNDQLMRDFPAPTPADAGEVARMVTRAVEATPGVKVMVDRGLADQVRSLVGPGVGPDTVVSW